MDPHTQELLKKWNEEHKVPLSAEELEELEVEEIISELPGGGHLEVGEIHHYEGAPQWVDYPFNYGMTFTQGPQADFDWETIDLASVKEQLCSFLGTTVEDIDKVYGPGGKTKEELKIRAELDEKLLRAVEGGVSKVLLARTMGWGLRKPHNQAPVLQKALKRARKARG